MFFLKGIIRCILCKLCSYSLRKTSPKILSVPPTFHRLPRQGTRSTSKRYDPTNPVPGDTRRLVGQQIRMSLSCWKFLLKKNGKFIWGWLDFLQLGGSKSNFLCNKHYNDYHIRKFESMMKHLGVYHPTRKACGLTTQLKHNMHFSHLDHLPPGSGKTTKPTNFQVTI